MQSRRHLGMHLAALSAILTTGHLPAMAAERTLRFGSISGEGNPTYAQTLQPFARAVEHESAGRLNVALKPAGGYGSPTEMFPMVEKGDLEMAATVLGYYPGRFPQTSVIELPLMFEDGVVGTRALAALLKEGLLDKDFATIKVIALYVSPPFSLFTTGKKIAALRDLRGLRVRVSSPTMGLALAKLGAIPVGMPVSSIGDAIAKGTVDAVAYNLDATRGTKGAGDKYLYEQLSVAVDLRFAAPAQMVAMHRATWDGLPADLQATIEKCAAAAIIADGGRIRGEAEVSAAKLFQADPRYTFVPYSPELHNEMQAALAPVYDIWQADMAKRGLDGERLLSRTRELVRQFSVASK
jgi:TRAP-type C4-dicarboxylate transport system substrate-binding protein